MAKATVQITDTKFRIVIPQDIRNLENIGLGDYIEIDIKKIETHDISDKILNDPEAADLACKLFERIATGQDARRSRGNSEQLS